MSPWHSSHGHGVKNNTQYFGFYKGRALLHMATGCMLLSFFPSSFVRSFLRSLHLPSITPWMGSNIHSIVYRYEKWEELYTQSVAPCQWSVYSVSALMVLVWRGQVFFLEVVCSASDAGVYMDTVAMADAIWGACFQSYCCLLTERVVSLSCLMFGNDHFVNLMRCPSETLDICAIKPPTYKYIHHSIAAYSPISPHYHPLVLSSGYFIAAVVSLIDVHRLSPNSIPFVIIMKAECKINNCLVKKGSLCNLQSEILSKMIWEGFLLSKRSALHNCTLYLFCHFTGQAYLEGPV